MDEVTKTRFRHLPWRPGSGTSPDIHSEWSMSGCMLSNAFNNSPKYDSPFRVHKLFLKKSKYRYNYILCIYFSKYIFIAKYIFTSFYNPVFSPSSYFLSKKGWCLLFLGCFATITILQLSQGISHGAIYFSRRAHLSSPWQISTHAQL